MHPHEKQIIRTFFLAATQPWYIRKLANERRRQTALNALDHLRDLDPRYITRLSNKTSALDALRSRGAPDSCYVLSDLSELDGKEMPLADAIDAVESDGCGSIVGCIPGRLAYWVGEVGRCRVVLERRATESAV